MGSTNPVFILPNALKEKAATIAAGMAHSITLGVGQFCTNPGLTFVEASKSVKEFSTHLVTSINEKPAGVMLTSGIKNAYERGIQNTESIKGVEALATGQIDKTTSSIAAKIFKTSLEDFHKNELLEEENFGPSNILVIAETKAEILAAAKQLKGHLTATVHGTEADFADYTELFTILEQKVGRVIINGYPTGVEVCPSMVHGGPYPATTAIQTTSVGTNAIKRFVRPICFQDYPASLLPKALLNANPLGIWRLVNGGLTKEQID